MGTNGDRQPVGTRNLTGVPAAFQNWIVVTVAQLCKFTKSHCIGPIIWANLLVYKLYLSEAV